MCDGTRHPHNGLSLHWFASLKIKLACYAAHVQRSEIGDQRSDGFTMKDVDALIILPSIAPTSPHSRIKIACCAFDKYKQSQAKSSHVSVSPFSPAASVSLLTKWASYFRFPHASRRFVQTEREERRIWSVKEYFSSAGNFLLASKISIANAYVF